MIWSASFAEVVFITGKPDFPEQCGESRMADQFAVGDGEFVELKSHIHQFDLRFFRIAVHVARRNHENISGSDLLRTKLR